MESCASCGGSGRIQEQRWGEEEVSVLCSVCGGSGLARRPPEPRADPPGCRQVVRTVLLLPLALVVLAVVGVVMLAVARDRADPGLREVTSEGSFTGLGVGACVDDGELPTAVDCAAPHDAEVYRILEVATETGEHPGEERLQGLAAERCPPHFGPYVGVPPEESSLFIGAWSPDEATWDFGVRRIVCLLRAGSPGPLTEVLRGSGR